MRFNAHYTLFQKRCNRKVDMLLYTHRLTQTFKEYNEL